MKAKYCMHIVSFSFLLFTEDLTASIQAVFSSATTGGN